MNAAYPRTSATAILSLVFGILCWVGLPFLGAIVAIVCGHYARGEIRRAPPGMIEGDGMAVAGLVLGWLQLFLVVAAGVALFAFFGGLAFLAQLGS